VRSIWPLAAAIREGRALDQAVLNFLAYMVAGDDIQLVNPKDPADILQTPYRLEAKRRHGKKGRPKDPGTFARDFVMAKQYEARVKELGPGKSGQAFEEIASEKGAGERTVRLARTKYRGK
jgi:hypothetical protein